MSGFAAIFHLDGAPVDRTWLEAMADALDFRGPDGRELWLSGNAGLCHTLLRTSAKSDGSRQIACLDGCLRIAGDVRVDHREELIAKLPQGAHDLSAASSAELILHAYAAWENDCVQHLLGDFSFVIWDGRRRRVFAARDQMAVRPFYYAQIGQCLLISNTLNSIRQLKIVPGELNDRAIGDFLLVGQNKYPAETFFDAIKRLPGAHRLTAGPAGVRTERYWTLPVEEPVYYKRAGDYVATFRDLLRRAVRDRLPDESLGVHMSGGLDSPLLAATAVELGAATTAFTAVYDRVIPDEERHYATLVAEHLGIPIRYRVRDDELWGWELDGTVIHTAEPAPEPISIASAYAYNREISKQQRVFFSGIGPDAAILYEWRAHLNYLIRRRRVARLGLDLLSDFWVCPRLHFLHRASQVLKERDVPDWYTPSFPTWFNKEFETRIDLRERWEEIHIDPVWPHPTRPLGYSSFAGDFPMGGLEDLDPNHTGTPVEYRHPFFDIPLLRFLLQIPAMPWCRDKYLVRTALKGLAPEAVRLRPKAPLGGLPYLERIRREGCPSLLPCPALARYVDRQQVPRTRDVDRESIDNLLKIAGLQLWLLRV
jgi:asparagine synthase (glutamine-hydrolysing)